MLGKAIMQILWRRARWSSGGGMPSACQTATTNEVVAKHSGGQYSKKRPDDSKRQTNTQAGVHQRSMKDGEIVKKTADKKQENSKRQSQRAIVSFLEERDTKISLIRLFRYLMHDIFHMSIIL